MAVDRKAAREKSLRPTNEGTEHGFRGKGCVLEFPR